MAHPPVECGDVSTTNIRVHELDRSSQRELQAVDDLAIKPDTGQVLLLEAMACLRTRIANLR